MKEKKKIKRTWPGGKIDACNVLVGYGRRKKMTTMERKKKSEKEPKKG